MSEDVRDEVARLVAEVNPQGLDDAGALELSSLEMVTLVDSLETRFGLRVLPSDLSPENFATLGALVAFVLQKRAGP